MTTTTPQATQSTGTGLGVVLELELSRIAEHPDNPRTSLGDVDGLAASMRARGLVQPIVVVPVEAFLASYAERPGGDGGVGLRSAAGITHVVYAGHRRRAAALQLGWDTITAIERVDLAGSAAATFIVENLHRADLTPLEEAVGYAQLRDLGRSQRQLAAEVGVSQSHVSKRLGLLRMPPEAQDALAADKITLAEAQALGSLSAADQVAAWDSIGPELKRYGRANVEWMVRRVAQENAARKAIEKHRRQAKHEGVELVDAAKTFGSAQWDHRLYDKRAIAKAKKDGTLRAEATEHGLNYYTTVEPKRAQRQTSQDREQAARRKAGKLRARACAELVQKRPSARQTVWALADAVLHGNVGHSNALRLVHSWLKDLYPVPASDISFGSGGTTSGHHADYYTWRDAQPEKHWQHIAWTMVVAAAELNARTSWITWGPRQAKHVRRLIDEVGYEPTEWEADQLARIDKQAAHGDSAGITVGTEEDAEHTGCTDSAGQPKEDLDLDNPADNWIDDVDESADVGDVEASAVEGAGHVE